jgi:hypothetical protein
MKLLKGIMLMSIAQDTLIMSRYIYLLTKAH